MLSDSLASLNLLMEIERRSGRQLSFEALFASPSIDSLARLLRHQGAVLPGAVTVRPAAGRDVDSICRLLEGASWSDSSSGPPGQDVWRALFHHSWLDEKLDLGFVLVHSDEIVGFLGTIYVKREINGKSGMVCNFSSWYVRQEYRGWGIALLRRALRDNITYTSLTPNLISRQVFKLLGFSPLGGSRLLLPPFLHADTLRHRTPMIVYDPVSVRLLLDGHQQRVFDDHAPYCLQLVVREGDDQTYIVVKRRAMLFPKIGRLLPKAMRLPFSDILHCSNPRLLARHLERVKFVILRRQKTLLLTAYAGLFPERPRGPVHSGGSLTS